MTLMDAPKFDVARSQRRSQIIYAILGVIFILLVAGWLVAGRPMDAPWRWWTYWAGQRDTDQFLQAVEAKDLNRAYAIWNNDPNWQQHAANYEKYPFKRFQEDWGPDSSANDYGTISSHELAIKKVVGEGSALIVGYMINGRKSKPLFLAYDTKAHTLGFSPFELRLE
jgi:hypothetical protein